MKRKTTFNEADLRRANKVPSHALDSSVTTAWGVGGRLTSASVFTAQDESSEEHKHLHSSRSMFLLTSPCRLYSVLERSILFWPLHVCPLLDFTVVYVCFCASILCMSASTKWPAWSFVLKSVCVANPRSGHRPIGSWRSFICASGHWGQC